MRTIFIICLVFFSLSSVFSQEELLNEIKKQYLQIDSLNKQVIRPKRDSISALKAEILEIQNEKSIISSARQDLIEINSELRSEIARLNQSRLKVENERFQKDIDSLIDNAEELKKTISAKDIVIEQEKKNCVQKLIREKEQGKQEALNQIIQSYNKPFDELIIFSTLESVERDLSIVGFNNELREKLIHLQKYLSSKKVLSEKYNKQKATFAQEQLSGLDQAELVKNLSDKINKYEIVNDGLKKAIENIIELQSQIIGNDEYAKEVKIKSILYELSLYFHHYRFNFIDYPYLSDIVLEIMKQKQRDANTDISYILNEL
jgi:hypothetical protein